MADYTNSKGGLGEVFPIGQVAADWARTEPLVTPEKLVQRHLWGLPLVSGMKDPITGVAARITSDMLVDFIDKAAATAELDTGLTIFPMQIEKKFEWSLKDYQSYGYFKIPHRPVASIESMTVNLSDNSDVYNVPLEWIETANLQWGQLNIIPLTVALMGGNSTGIPTTGGGMAFLSAFQGRMNWIPAFWKIRYTIGFPQGALPKMVNELIGVIAAMDVLSQLGATYGKSSGSSMSIDGFSQSVSTPGPEIFKTRLADLEAKRQMLVRKLKNLYSLRLFSDNV
jgi:hypothetical protein